MYFYFRDGAYVYHCHIRYSGSLQQIQFVPYIWKVDKTKVEKAIKQLKNPRPGKIHTEEDLEEIPEETKTLYII